MVMTLPAIATTKPAPFASLTSRTWTSWPVGAPLAPASVESFEKELTARYEAQYKLHPAIYRFTPAAGARRVA